MTAAPANYWAGICTALVKSYGLQQQFITPYTPEQNGMVERVIRTLREQCVHRHRFESLAHTSRVIEDWIGFSASGLGDEDAGDGVSISSLTCAEIAGSLQH